MGNIMGKISQYCEYNEFLDLYYINEDIYDDHKNDIIKDKTAEELIEIMDLVNNNAIVNIFYNDIRDAIEKFNLKIGALEEFLNDSSLTTITREQDYMINHNLIEFQSKRVDIIVRVKDCNEADSPLWRCIWKIVSFDDIWEAYGEGRDLYEIVGEEYGLDMTVKVGTKLKELIIIDD